MLNCCTEDGAGNAKPGAVPAPAWPPVTGGCMVGFCADKSISGISSDDSLMH